MNSMNIGTKILHSRLKN